MFSVKGKDVKYRILSMDINKGVMKGVIRNTVKINLTTPTATKKDAVA